MRPIWLFLGLLAACTRIPLDKDVDADADADADADSDTDADTDTDTDTDPVIDCGEPPMRGAWWDDHPSNGVPTQASRPDNDAGVAAVRAAGDAVTQITVLPKPLPVRGALVTFVGFRPSGTDVLEAWVADANVALFLRFVTIPQSVGLAPGDIVDFDVNVVSSYGGLGQVTNQTSKKKSTIP